MNIICNNLSIGYNNIPLYENINFTISKGAYVCIVGENGTGKSTLVKTILGLLPPLEGNVFMDVKKNGVNIGYLPQQTQIQQDFPASAYEIVLSGCLNKMGLRPFYTKKEKKLAKEMLEKLGILKLSKRSYSELSGGQQQRVLLARALCATNKILLLDEPTSGLDADTTKEFYKIIKNLNLEGITIIMITHKLQEVINDADCIISLTGEKVEYLSKKDYIERGE